MASLLAPASFPTPRQNRTLSTQVNSTIVMMRTLLVLLLLTVSRATATATQTAHPLITEPPSLADRAVTSFHTIVSTPFPQNRWSIGYGKMEGDDNFYTAACVDGLFAVSGIWVGCGSIIFTRCVGATAFAQSTTVSCMGTCLTHKIFDYNDKTSSTRFIACNFPGTYDGSMTLLKTPIGGTAEATTGEISTATSPVETTATETTDSSVGQLRSNLKLLAICFVFFLLSV